MGQKFVGNRFAMQNRDQVVTLAHTAYAYRGDACFYVFNVGDKGFVILSADDFYRPVIGYSENGSFDVNNVPPALQYYLDGIVEARSLNKSTGEAAPDVAADWRMLQTTGRLVSRNGGRGTDYFVKTQWDQSYPYNCMCPDDPAGSGGHAIVGCLATAMSQLMRFWAYPIRGIGSHCYYHEDYGQICADFGATTYDWDNMPNMLANNSPEEQKIATGTLCFHCGVSIDMGYGPDGSGGGSGGIPDVMHDYFDYCDAIVQLRRDDFDTRTWKNMVREQFDMGWPMYYGGCENDGCHAFVCDGYDDYDMFHFNLGWGGSSDGWYLIDDAPYTHPADAMFNYVPRPVYEATPSAPANLTVTVPSDTSLDATLTWTNPTTLLDGSSMTAIDKIVVMRNYKVVYETADNVVPGQQMTWIDHVPYYDNYDYKVYAVCDGHNGKQAINQNVGFGPTCKWKFVMTATQNNGWGGNYISVYNMAGTEVARVTTTTVNPIITETDVPLGTVRFGWNQSSDTTEVSFKIKDSENNILYQYNGSSVELKPGVFCTANNGCGNQSTCDALYNLGGEADDEAVVLTWDGDASDSYGVCVYRDEVLYKMVTDNSGTYTDDDTNGLGHCYQLSKLCSSGESELSETVCVTVGESCNPPTHLWYEVQNNFKPVIKWERPVNDEGLTGYVVYAKKETDQSYQIAKMLGPNKTEYKESKNLADATWYYYKVVAFYQDIDCYSIPAKALYGREYFVRYYYSTDDVAENNENGVVIYPNPVKDVLTVKAENISQVAVYNAIGQMIFNKSVDSSEVTINLDGFDSGVYLVRVVADGNAITRKVSVIK